jgi:PleD family two-component response regulator
VLRFVAGMLKRGMMKGRIGQALDRRETDGVTISIWVAALHNRTSPQALLEAADVCLCAAKRSGRNCVVGEKDERLLTAMAG